MPTDQQIEDLTRFAVEIAEESGTIATRYFRKTCPVENKSDRRFDPVTQADREIEKFLRARIQESYPGYGITGEEQEDTAGSAGTWVIDPIDGTRGFVSGAPMWGILLGLMETGRHLLGVMHQPVMQETFFANPAGAWWKRGGEVQDMHTRATDRLADAILYCTHPAMFSAAGVKKAFTALESKCQYSRYGGDCYGYCLLAAGFIDLVVEGSLQPYDVIPLIPIVESAGGVITDWQGHSPDRGGRIVAAANHTLHRAALELLHRAEINL